MDAGPILRDIMLGHYAGDGDDSIFSDIAVGELAASSEICADDARVAQPEPPRVVTRTASARPKSCRQARPNYAVLAGKSRTCAKGESLSSSDDVHVDDDEDPGSPGSLGELDEDYLEAFKSRGSCMTKNAIAARENRLKKKLYVSKLERSVRALSTENATLKRRSQDMNREIEELSEEVQYLRSVLCNVDEISTLVRSIRSVRPSLATSLTNGAAPKRQRMQDDHDYISAGGKRRPPGESAGGVCIHVDNGAVSLEFCHRCAAKSKKFGMKKEEQCDVVSSVG